MLVGNARVSTTLMGGSGDDMLTGGAGGDTFVYGSGNDTISDFQISVRGGATDKIDLTALDLSPTELGDALKDAERGTYNAANGTFTASTDGTGDDTRLIFGDNVAAGNNLVLVDINNQGAQALEVGDFLL